MLWRHVIGREVITFYKGGIYEAMSGTTVYQSSGREGREVRKNRNGDSKEIWVQQGCGIESNLRKGTAGVLTALWRHGQRAAYSFTSSIEAVVTSADVSSSD